MSADEFGRYEKELDIDATPQARQRPMMPPDIAGEAVTSMVKANARVILQTRSIGAQRIRDSRNALSESAYSHFELVSMLAVAIDRLAVHEALIPSRDIEQVSRILRQHVESLMPKAVLYIGDSEYDKMARRALDR